MMPPPGENEIIKSALNLMISFDRILHILNKDMFEQVNFQNWQILNLPI
jgi:hypothetical protein